MKWNKDNFLRHAAITLAGTKLSDFFNFLYRLAMARLLTVEDYGVFNTLISFLAVASQFLAPFQPAFTRFVAERVSLHDYEGARSLLRRAFAALAVFAAAIFLLFLLAAPALAGFLRLERSGYVVMVGTLVALTVMAAIPGAFLQGAQRFTALSAIAAGSSLGKLLIGTALVLGGVGIYGALGGFVAG
ncbi:MAG: oligosaccharide flippase family protein, partial [Candidatus Aureabacteria bacterium]|nr:oligosaccharide flippase family protein [Candidatus Auribacterota bacterium]